MRILYGTAGLAGLVFGGFVMSALLIGMHRHNQTASENVDTRARVIEVVREQRTKEPVRKTKPPPKKNKPQKRAPLPNLDSVLAGVDLNIPEFEVEDFSGSAKNLLGAVSRGGIMSESNVDSKPRVISRTPLVYPKPAIRKNINGYVLLNLLIDERGEIEAAKVLDAQPEGVFESAALRGVQDWRFSPARYQGQPVKVWAKQRIRFDAR